MKHRISEIGVQMLEYQEQLAREHKYKPIPRTFFYDVRAEFQKALPEWCNISGDATPLVLDDIHDLPEVVEKVFAGHPEFTHTFFHEGN